jgi:hypothetical protein
LLAAVRLAVHDDFAVYCRLDPEKPAALAAAQLPRKITVTHLPILQKSLKMHRRPMVAGRIVGQSAVRATRPESCPVPPLALILGVIRPRVNQKTAGDKREKPNYSEFPNSWAGELTRIP